MASNVAEQLTDLVGNVGWRFWRDSSDFGTWVQIGDNPEACRFFDDVCWCVEDNTLVLDWAKEVKACNG